MKDQIEALHRLQKQDHRLVSIERKLGAIPRRKKDMERDLSKLEAMLQTEVDRLEDSRSFRMDQDRQLQEERDQIRNSKQRISQVKTPRELSAAQRELDSTRRLADAREGKIEEIDGAISDFETRIATMKAGLDELRETFSTERARLDKIEAKQAKAHKKVSKSRESLLVKIAKPTLRRYERIRKRVGGVGFVAVRERRCSACKMAVAHQTYVALRNAEEIPLCENCGRMLFWIGLFPEDENADEPKPKAAP